MLVLLSLLAKELQLKTFHFGMHFNRQLYAKHYGFHHPISNTMLDVAVRVKGPEINHIF